jgi:hypothetical protein
VKRSIAKALIIQFYFKELGPVFPGNKNAVINGIVGYAIKHIRAMRITGNRRYSRSLPKVAQIGSSYYKSCGGIYL